MTYESKTLVRTPRVWLMWTVAGVYLATMLASALGHIIVHGSGFPFIWWTIGPALAAIQRRPKMETAAVKASPEGLRVGGRFYPRSRFTSALMRNERERSYVSLRAARWGANVDVAVRDDAEADALCTAMGLDAKSTTAEFGLMRQRASAAPMLFGIALAFMVMGAAFTVGLHNAPLAAAIAPLVLVLLFVLMLPLLFLSRRVKLRVGADGLVVREGFKRNVFYAHDSITRVRAEDRTVIITPKHGAPLELLTGQTRGSRGNSKMVVEEQRQQAQSIVWRIEKAREAYAALAGMAPQAALALDRGERTMRDWLDTLRRVGEGDGATFRHALPTRDQLLAVVESTTAAARERLAALVALRGKLSEDERPRVRVAAERCVAPELRERMVRVLDAPSDEEIEAVLSETESQQAGS